MFCDKNLIYVSALVFKPLPRKIFQCCSVNECVGFYCLFGHVVTEIKTYNTIHSINIDFSGYFHSSTFTQYVVYLLDNQFDD